MASKSTRDEVLETVRSLLNAPGCHTIPNTIRLRLHFDELCRHIDTLKERVAVLEAQAHPPVPDIVGGAEFDALKAAVEKLAADARPARPKISRGDHGGCAVCGVPAHVACAHEWATGPEVERFKNEKGGDDGE